MSERRRVSYANIMSTVAVVLALTTGGAYAAGLGKNSVKSKHIVANAIKAKHIAANAVQGSDITAGAVDAATIKDGSVGAADLGDNAVGSGELAAGSVGTSELVNSSVIDSKIATESVGTSEIKNGAIQGEDVGEGEISSTRMTTGVRRLLFDAGTLPVNQTFGTVNVTNDNWSGSAPTGGGLAVSWTQPADSLDLVSGIARVEFPAACSDTAGTARGLDVKIVDEDGRVISASAAQRTGGVNYNGNGFWADEEALDGVAFRAPLASSAPGVFIDYIHLPFEKAELVGATSGNTTRTVRIYFKRSSTLCTPEVSQARVIVYRYADES